MNLLLKNNSYSLFLLLFLLIVFVSCVSNKTQIPAPNLTMANKIQFDAESKENERLAFSINFTSNINLLN